MGALLQTEQSKTVQADIRLMGALTGLGITEGTIRLGLQLPFANAKQFEAQSSDIQGLIRGGIFWEVNGKSCRVNLRESPGEVSGEPSHYALMVAPEDYFSEKLVRVLQNDEKGRPYPDWSGMSRLIIGLGFQTTNITCIDQEDLFDPLLSRSIDFGMNVLYRDIADNLNEDPSNFVNFSNPEFIEKVNYVMGLNPLDIKVDFNRRLRIPGVAQQQTLEQFRSFCEARKNSFFSSLLTKLGFGKDNKKIVQAEVDIARLFASTGRFMVVGGGAYAFGEMLLESLDNYEGFISPVPDIASALGMGLAVLMGELDL